MDVMINDQNTNLNIHQKSVRVAVVNPPHAGLKLILFSVPYLVNGLRKMNPDVKIEVFDCTATELGLSDLYLQLEKFQPNIIGVSIPFSVSLNASIDILKKSRDLFPLAWTVVGGVHPTLEPRDLVEYADYTVIGDGEIPFTNIIQAYKICTDVEIQNRKLPRKIPSVVFFEDGKMKSVPVKEDTMYMGDPDWNGLDLTPFLSPVIYGDVKKGFSIFTSKGCPFVCTYCSNHLLWGRKIVYRDFEGVFNEIKWMMDHYRIEQFVLEDDLFTVDQKRVYEFCDLIEKKGLKFEWMFQTRGNLVGQRKRDQKMFERMKEVGATVANMGIESGSQRVLQSNKQMDKQVIVDAVKMLKEMGYLIYAGFIIGFPEDDIESVWDTIAFPDQLDIDSPGFQLMIPYPKTSVRDKALKEGGILTNDYSKYSTFNVVYVPPGLQGYDLLEIRKFAYAYFHTRSKERLDNFLKRYIGKPEYDTVKTKYTAMYINKEVHGLKSLERLKLKSRAHHIVESNARLPI